MVSPWRDPGQQLPEACCARRARLVWYSCYTLTFLDLLGDRFRLVWYSWYTRTFLDLLGDRFGLVWFSCYTLTFLDLLGDRFGLVWYSCYTLTFLDLLGDRFSVSDSGVRFYYPGVRSWQSGDRFRYTGVRFLVPDSDILVTDPGDRFGRCPPALFNTVKLQNCAFCRVVFTPPRARLWK